MSLLRSSIATVVWGRNIAIMNTMAAAIETAAWTSVSRWARACSRSSAVISASSETAPAPSAAEGASGLTS